MKRERTRERKREKEEEIERKRMRETRTMADDGGEEDKQERDCRVGGMRREK